MRRGPKAGTRELRRGCTGVLPAWGVADVRTLGGSTIVPWRPCKNPADPPSSSPKSHRFFPRLDFVTLSPSGHHMVTVLPPPSFRSSATLSLFHALYPPPPAFVSSCGVSGDTLSFPPSLAESRRKRDPPSADTTPTNRSLVGIDTAHAPDRHLDIQITLQSQTRDPHDTFALARASQPTCLAAPATSNKRQYERY